MKEQKYRRFSWRDLVVLAVVLTLGTVAFLVVGQHKRAKTATVTYRDEVLVQLSLTGETRQYTYQLPEGEIVLQTGERGIRVLESNCPDKTCVHMGWISDKGRSIVCMPLYVTVTLNGSGDVDGTTG